MQRCVVERMVMKGRVTLALVRAWCELQRNAVSCLVSMWRLGTHINCDTVCESKRLTSQPAPAPPVTP